MKEKNALRSLHPGLDFVQTKDPLVGAREGIIADDLVIRGNGSQVFAELSLVLSVLLSAAVAQACLALASKLCENPP